MGKPRAFTDEQERNEIGPKYLAGASFSELAAEYGVSTPTIGHALRRVGVPRRKAGPRPGMHRPRVQRRLFTEEQAAELAVRYRDGALVAELAEEAGVSRKAVNNALRRQGVTFRNRREASLKKFAHARAKGQRHVNWKGGRHVNDLGYVLVRVDPEDSLAIMRSGHGYVLEHRLVMARSLGRPLTPDETVHHLNGIKDDNRIENLELWTGRHGRGIRAHEPHCRTCTCFEL